MINKKNIEIEQFYTDLDEKMLYNTEKDAQDHEAKLLYHRKLKTIDIPISFHGLGNGKLFFCRDKEDLRGFTESWWTQHYEVREEIEKYPCWLYYFRASHFEYNEYTCKNEEEDDGMIICTLEYLEGIIKEIQTTFKKARKQKVTITYNT